MIVATLPLAASTPFDLSSISYGYQSQAPSQSSQISPTPPPRPKRSSAVGSSFLDEEFYRHRSPERRAEIVRDQLYQLYLGRPHGGKLNVTLSSELPGNVLGMSLDPENVTLEAEYFGGIDRGGVRHSQTAALVLEDVRPLPDRPQPLAGHALPLYAGASHLCHMGSGVKIHNGVDLTYGYKLTRLATAQSSTRACCSTIAAASPSAKMP